MKYPIGVQDFEKIISDGYVYVMEFKKDGSAQSALEQIRERGYTKPYLADKRKVFSIGVNFSSEKGTIEEYVFE